MFKFSITHGLLAFDKGCCGISHGKKLWGCAEIIVIDIIAFNILKTNFFTMENYINHNQNNDSRPCALKNTLIRLIEN